MTSRSSSVEFSTVIVSFESRMRRSIRRFVRGFPFYLFDRVSMITVGSDYELSVDHDGQPIDVDGRFCERP